MALCSAKMTRIVESVFSVRAYNAGQHHVERGSAMRFLFALVMSAIIGPLLRPADAQIAADLAWRFSEGQELVYRSRVQTIERATGDDPYTSDWSHEIHHTDRVLSVDADGNARIERTYDRVLVRVRHSRLGNAAYDSARPPRPGDTDADHPLVRPFAALAGRTISFTVSPEGKVSDIRGLREAMQGISAGLDGNELLRDGLPAFSAVTADAFEEQLRQSMHILPGRRVRRGESWEVGIDQPMPVVGTVRSSSVYRFERLDRHRGRPVARIAVRSTLTLEPSRVADELARMLRIEIRDSVGSGTVLVDTDLGVVRDWQQCQATTFAVEVGGGLLNGHLLRREVRTEQQARMELISGDR